MARFWPNYTQDQGECDKEVQEIIMRLFTSEIQVISMLQLTVITEINENADIPIKILSRVSFRLHIIAKHDLGICILLLRESEEQVMQLESEYFEENTALVNVRD